MIVLKPSIQIQYCHSISKEHLPNLTCTRFNCATTTLDILFFLSIYDNEI